MHFQLKQSGYPTGIVSNAPWGSPPVLWRDELIRLGLAAAVDSVVFCGDVGWRKPAPQIFRHAADTLDRESSQTDYAERRIEDLPGLFQLFEADA